LSVEEAASQGRVDLSLRFNEQVYLFEFKVVELEPEGRALEQLKRKRYAEKYLAGGQTIHLIGVEFSRETKRLAAFDVEELTPCQPG